MTAVGVIFGSRSVEHEVSVISGQQVVAALQGRYEVVPIYIAKDGTWYVGDGLRSIDRFADLESLLRDCDAVTPTVDTPRKGLLLGGRRSGLRRHIGPVARIDVAFPVVHGSHGEDGTLQGVFELSDLPYVGCGVAAAAISMDKPMAKKVFRSAGLPVLDDVTATRAQWSADREAVLARIRSSVGLPAYVKPATLGSSIGVTRVDTDGGLADAIDLATAYDDRFLVEAAQDDIVEINCAVLGWGDDLRVSLCEQPAKQGGLLSYEDKYAGGKKGGAKSAPKPGGSEGPKSGGMAGAGRQIPAPIDETLTAQIQAMARAAFTAIGAAGVARVDFLVRSEKGQVILNEINTIPGSLAFYLFQPQGLDFSDLCVRLVEIALEGHQARSANIYSIDGWLLKRFGQAPE